MSFWLWKKSDKKPKGLSDQFREADKVKKEKPKDIKPDAAMVKEEQVNLNRRLEGFNNGLKDRLIDIVSRRRQGNDVYSFASIYSEYPLTEKQILMMPNYKKLHAICADPEVNVRIWISTHKTYSGILADLDSPYKDSIHKNCYKEAPSIKFEL